MRDSHTIVRPPIPSARRIRRICPREFSAKFTINASITSKAHIEQRPILTGGGNSPVATGAYHVEASLGLRVPPEPSRGTHFRVSHFVQADGELLDMPLCLRDRFLSIERTSPMLKSGSIPTSIATQTGGLCRQIPKPVENQFLRRCQIATRKLFPLGATIRLGRLLLSLCSSSDEPLVGRNEPITGDPRDFARIAVRATR